jgi:hypothetical protein
MEECLIPIDGVSVVTQSAGAAGAVGPLGVGSLYRGRVFGALSIPIVPGGPPDFSSLLGFFTEDDVNNAKHHDEPFFVIRIDPKRAIKDEAISKIRLVIEAQDPDRKHRYFKRKMVIQHDLFVTKDKKTDIGSSLKNLLFRLEYRGETYVFRIASVKHVPPSKGFEPQPIVEIFP